MATTILDKAAVSHEKLLNEIVEKLLPKRKVMRLNTFQQSHISANLEITTELEFDRTKYNCAVLRGHVDKNDGVIYGIVYVEKNVPKYISWSATYKSADGEYRHRLVPWNTIVRHMEEYEYIISDQIIAMKSGKNKKSVDISISVMINNKYTTDIINRISSDDMHVKLLLLLSWIDVDPIIGSYHENHIAPAYKELLKRMEIYTDKMKSKHRPIWVNTNMSYPFIVVDGDSSKVKHNQSIELGQKIIPIGVALLEDPDNIKYAGWREIYLGRKVANLSINRKTNSFPYFYNWFIFKYDKNRSLYDNTINHLRLDLSDVSTNIVDELELAASRTYLIEAKTNTRLHLSNKMKELAGTIGNSVEYAEEELMLSDYAICTINEYMGKTVADVSHLYDNLPMFAERTGPIFSDLRHFKRLVFTYLYGMYVANKEYGIIHGDLHLNNMTVSSRSNIVIQHAHHGVATVFNNPHIAYDVDGKLYLFPFGGALYGIIDFGRSLISAEQIKKDVGVGVGGANSINSNSNIAGDLYSDLIYDQTSRIMQIYARDFPEYYEENKIKLRIALQDNYSRMHKIASMGDAYKLCSGLRHLYELRMNDDTSGARNDTEFIRNTAIPFLETLVARCHKYLTEMPLSTESQSTSSTNITNWPISDLFDEFTDCTVEKYGEPYQNADNMKIKRLVIKHKEKGTYMVPDPPLVRDANIKKVKGGNGLQFSDDYELTIEPFDNTFVSIVEAFSTEMPMIYDVNDVTTFANVAMPKAGVDGVNSVNKKDAAGWLQKYLDLQEKNKEEIEIISEEVTESRAKDVAESSIPDSLKNISPDMYMST